MRYLLLIALVAFSACMTPSNHLPAKRPDFSVPSEQRVAPVTTKSCSCGCCK